jgi:hypothetical protein
MRKHRDVSGLSRFPLTWHRSGNAGPHACSSRGHLPPPPPLGSYRRREPEHSVLHQVLRGELESFLARQHDRGRPVPRFVERELRGFLECGILAHGFVRVHCDACGKDRLVAFSCKGRGFCPSCGGRRMADTAAWLLDRVVPFVPVRQWVLTLPFPLRFRMAYDAGLTSDVLRIFLRAVFSSLRRRACRKRAIFRPQGGAVTFVQRFGDALNLNVHVHALVLDGVFEARGRGGFRPAPPPDRLELERVLRRVARRLENSWMRGACWPASWPTTSRCSPAWRTPPSAAGSPPASAPAGACSGSATGSIPRT